jgi:lysosomal acid lipase/cholesteryl ester hydrolase
MVQRRGYKVHEHWVSTDDGYILGTFNIPPTKTMEGVKPPVVLFMHALLCTSVDYVNNFANESLPYLLADQGFDVWLGNNRGNTYSTNHSSLNTTSKAFWEFTFDQMSQYDLPATVSYVLKETGASNISYVGHSEGTIQAFAAFSDNQAVAAKINLFVAFAPVTTVYHQKSPLFSVMADLGAAEWLTIFGVKKFLASNSAISKIAPGLCKTVPHGCDDAIFLFCGPTTHLNETRLQVYVSETPAGTSVRNMQHWSQLCKHNVFQHYDYGSKKTNMQHYNQSTPPAYKLADVTVPTALFTGGQDALADPKDVAQLIQALPSSTVIAHLDVPSYAHLDFAWGYDAATYVYPKAIELLKAAAGMERHPV